MKKSYEFLDACGERYADLYQEFINSSEYEIVKTRYLIAVASLINAQTCICAVLKTVKPKKRKKIFNRLMRNFEKEIFELLEEKNESVIDVDKFIEIIKEAINDAK